MRISNSCGTIARLRKEETLMPIYYCKSCGFTFKRVGKVESCPDCGKPDVCPALEHEVQEFWENQDKWDKA